MAMVTSRRYSQAARGRGLCPAWRQLRIAVIRVERDHFLWIKQSYLPGSGNASVPRVVSSSCLHPASWWPRGESRLWSPLLPGTGVVARPLPSLACVALLEDKVHSVRPHGSASQIPPYDLSYTLVTKHFPQARACPHPPQHRLSTCRPLSRAQPLNGPHLCGTVRNTLL